MKKQLPNLEYKDNLEVAVTLFEEKQSIDWSTLAYRNYNESFSGDAQFFKTSSLTTLVYHNQNNKNINVGGYIFRNIDKNAPRRAGFIEDQIFVTVHHNTGGWSDHSQSFIINVKNICENNCEYNEYSVSDQEVKEILDILLEQEYILQNR